MPPIDAAQLFSVPGLVAVVTGGGTGIGLMMAQALAANGAAKVYIVGRRQEKLDEAAVGYPNIIPVVGDVTSKESLQAVVDRVTSETGYINLLIANSGVVGPVLADLTPKPTLSQFRDYAWNWGMEDFTNTFHVNVTSVFFTVVAFLELLDAGNKKGNMPLVSSQVIVTGSVASYLRSVLTGFAYVTSKGAAVHLMKCLATYLAPHNIRVNALAPGLFPSPMADGMINKISTPGPEGVRLIDSNNIPAGRAGTEQDMAGTVLYLASRAGAYCNGVAVLIDGGRLSVLPGTY